MLSKETIENKTTGLINDALKHLETLKTSFKNDMENKVKALSENFDSEVSKLTSLLSRVMHQKHILSVSVSQGSNEECLVERENILGIKDEIRNESDAISPDSLFGTFRFTVDHNLLNLTSKITAFQNISLSKRCMKSGQIKLLKKVKLCNDYCRAVFRQDDILITDFSGKRVTVVDISLNLKFSIQVPGNPRDITIGDRERVLVSLQNEKEVVEIDMITKSVISLFSIVRTCSGILWMNDKFIIASGDKIELYRYDGIKQMEITTKDTWTMCRKQNEETLLYPKDDTVIENSQFTNEKNLFTCSGADLRGIDTDIEGNIYTVGMSSNKLYQLSPDGSLLKEVDCSSFNLKDLFGVCLNDKNNIVITTCGGDVALFEIVCTS
uniref:Tripartite motif-containing protein 2 n=1 Tax=Magallana gigas TaxID=29159 RepID=K1PIR3_MAGGI